MLELIKNVDDIKNLSVAQLPQLCSEIREKLVHDVTISGGHLASNLGVVELTVALHYVFNVNDKIVWDVGHQSYVHKILSGRSDSFCSLRSSGGISGFPDCDESPTDGFNTGHAGTAISAGLGLAKARDIAKQNYKVVAVVGDGSMTCGMTYEALNNLKDTNMLVVLNDNNMSISDNVGVATLNMSKLRVGKYDKNKERLKKILYKIPLVGKPTYNLFRWFKRKYKLKFVRNSYFDTFDLKYIGIIDGNEVKDLVHYLTKIRDNVTKPTVLHVVTKKGKGYACAEQDAESYHSVSPQNTVGKGIESATIVGQTLCNLAKNNANIVAVCAAMTRAVGFETFKKDFENRFFDVGIAEEHAVTFSAGLAKGGLRPFVAIYSTFLQRSYDQILHDVALQNLPVTFLIDRAGFVGEDGKTHQGLFDLSYLGQIPNLQIWTPSTYRQLQQMIEKASKTNFPVAIRYGKYLLDQDVDFDGKWNVLRQSAKPKIHLICVGANLSCATMQLQMDDVSVVQATTVNPLDDNYLQTIKSGVVVTLEENVVFGGFGSKICQYFSTNNNVKVYNLGVDDKFVCHATVEQQLQQNALDCQSIKEKLLQLLDE